MVDSKTKKIISISEKPGTFGVEFHNKGYELLGLNYIYIPLKINKDELKIAMQIVRDNFHGCSVSMPHKIKVIEYLDAFDESAELTGAVNTILNKNRYFTGFNTDFDGAKKAIEGVLDIKDKEVVMIGAGGAARAIGLAVKNLGGKLTITNRTSNKGKELAERLKCNYLNYGDLKQVSGYLLINGTSVGMDNPLEMIVDNSVISRFEAIMDVVIPGKRLLEESKRQHKIVIPGKTMTLYQAAKQFKIYTGKELPKEFIDRMLNN
jgi:shikimate dehydrogenase